MRRLLFSLFLFSLTLTAASAQQCPAAPILSNARGFNMFSEEQESAFGDVVSEQRLTTLGARPYLQACDRELATVGAPAGTKNVPALPGLTRAEQAVARLVAAGRSNRQTAAELYISVKTVEFHLGHIFDKFGIRSRQDLITLIGAPSP